MYRIYIHLLGSKIELTNFTLEGASFGRFRYGYKRLRDEINGSITFFGADFDRLLDAKEKNIYESELDLYLDEQLLLSAKLNIDGKYYLSQKKCELEVTTSDAYTLFEKKGDEDITFTSNNAPYITLIVDVQATIRNEMQCGEKATDLIFPDPFFASCGEIYTPSQVQPYDAGVSYTKARLLGNDNDGDAYYSGIVNEAYSSWYNPQEESVEYYAANGDGFLDNPSLGTNDWTRVNGSFKKMGQKQAPIMMNGSQIYEATGLATKPGCTITGQEQWQISAPFLKSVLEYVVSQIDNTVTVGDWDLGLNYLFINFDTTDLTYNPAISFDTIMGTYMALFGADWYIDESNVLQIETYQGSEPLTPGDYQSQPYQYINKLFSNDWSSEELSYDIQNKVDKFSLSMGESDYADLSTQIITYDVPYNSTKEISTSDVTVDLARISLTTSQAFVVLSSEDGTWITGGTGVDGQYVYNYGLSLYQLIQDYHIYGMPFIRGTHTVEGGEYPITAFGSRERVDQFTINIPLNRQDLIDFNYYIVSEFGNLQIDEISIDFLTQSATIKAKQ